MIFEETQQYGKERERERAKEEENYPCICAVCTAIIRLAERQQEERVT